MSLTDRLKNAKIVLGSTLQISMVSTCSQFDVTLRINEKRTLNTLNDKKNAVTIRYPMKGKIKSSDMKINWSDLHYSISYQT